MRSLNRLILSLGVIALMHMPVSGQLSNSLYFMSGVPQTGRVNPAHQPMCGFYIGFPGIAPLRLDVSSGSLAFGDVIYPHPSQDSLITFLHPLGDKQAFLDLLEPVNFISTDLGTSLFSMGFRTGIGFFSLDVSTRMDGNVYYPGDLFQLVLNGAEEGRTYQFDGIGADVSVFDEVSVGWSGSILDNLNIGVRAKVLFGIGNLTTKRSELSLTTSSEVWSLQSDMQMNASLPFARVTYDQEGMFEDLEINPDLDPPDAAAIPGYIFNNGNMGMGVDLGVDYRPVESLLLSASVMDLGFIRWKDEVHEVSYQTEYDFEGIEIDLLELLDENQSGGFDSTLTQLGDSLASFVDFTPGTFYSNRLNTKLFIGASYTVVPGINFGLLSRTDFLSGNIVEQVTATVNLNAGRMLNFTLSYSYMNAYFKNFGTGLSFNLGPLNMYLISDNVLNAVFWPQEARSLNLWFGLNLVFGYRQFRDGGINDRPLLY